MRRGTPLAFFIATAVGFACHSSSPGGHPDSGPDAVCTPGEQRCQGADREACEDGTAWVVLQRCEAETPLCLDELGCVSCQPGVPFCDGDGVRSCLEDGSPGAVQRTCDDPEVCDAGECVDPCARAAEERASAGCEFWATSTISPDMSGEFDEDFGVLVHNPGERVAHLSITRQLVPVLEVDVPPGEAHVIALPFVTPLRDAQYTVLFLAGAYRIRSTQPVTAVQMNPLHYKIGTTKSGANDGSLLLPTHGLSGRYLVLARQTQGFTFENLDDAYHHFPGYMTVVGTQNDTRVTVTYTAHTQGGHVDPATPGAEVAYLLQEGEALQVLSAPPAACAASVSSEDCNGAHEGLYCAFCDAGRDYDLTGTSIEASAPVAVFAGHACAFVPFDRVACDHLEEQLFPLETWGREVVVGRTEPQVGPLDPEEPNVVRILSGANGNQIAFDPPLPGVPATTVLDRGAFLEVTAQKDFRVLATAAVSVGQLLVGQGEVCLEDPGCPEDTVGDPSLSLVAPVEQYRTRYAFVVPDTFLASYVNVTKRVGPDAPPVTLDGEPLPESAFGPPIGSSSYGVARLPIDGTAHLAESDEPFGLSVYGFAYYTSYAYPAGIGLEVINP